MGAGDLMTLFLLSLMAAFLFRNVSALLWIAHVVSPAFQLVEVQYGALTMEVPCWILFLFRVLVPLPLRKHALPLSCLFCTFYVMMQGWGLLYCDDPTFHSQQTYEWLSEWATFIAQVSVFQSYSLWSGRGMSRYLCFYGQLLSHYYRHACMSPL